MNRLLTSLIVVLAATNLSAQQIAELPKLVVGITVDQLRGDYLTYLYNAFGEKGFKRLIQNGLLYENVDFKFDHPERSSAMATLYTGTYPSYNGIIANTLFNKSTQRIESILYDLKFMGNYTSQTVSPNRILTSTITDELKIGSDGLSRVYAIAPDFEQAIIGAGHAADGAFWIDDMNGKWATTTFYRDVPFYLDRYNRTDALDKRIEQAVWEPMLPVSAYKFVPYFTNDWSFKHSFAKIRKNQIKQFKTSALINNEINRLVALFLENGEFGKKSCPDFLSITYNAGTFLDGTPKQYSLETQDTYLRLDQNIGQLLDMIDKSVGLNNTLIFLTSTGNYNTDQEPTSRYHIPGGEFHPDRCTTLLNTYLMAIYGHQNWVSAYHDQQIYLNRRTIEDQKISLQEIQQRAAEFVIQFAGIQNVVTSTQLLHGNWNPQNERYYNGFNRQLSGDLILAIQPGWKIVSDNSIEEKHVVRMDGIPAPAIFFGPHIQHDKISRTIDATQIAPSVAKILRIRSPNGCRVLPLPEIQ